MKVFAKLVALAVSFVMMGGVIIGMIMSLNDGTMTEPMAWAVYASLGWLTIIVVPVICYYVIIGVYALLSSLMR